MTVKNLFENEELLNGIVEDLDDIPEDTEVSYEVWAFRQTKDNTVSEFLMNIFDNPDAAIKYAKTFELVTPDGAEPIYSHISLEVETVIADPDDEDGGTMNIGTIYQRDLY